MAGHRGLTIFNSAAGVWLLREDCLYVQPSSVVFVRPSSPVAAGINVAVLHISRLALVCAWLCVWKAVSCVTRICCPECLQQESPGKRYCPRECKRMIFPHSRRAETTLSTLPHSISLPCISIPWALWCSPKPFYMCKKELHGE